MMMVVESMDSWVWLSLTIINQVPFLANIYVEDNKFYFILLIIIIRESLFR